MVICDRHFTAGEYVAGPNEIKTSQHETYHLCESCSMAFQQFLNTMGETDGTKRTRKPAKRGKKKIT